MSLLGFGTVARALVEQLPADVQLVSVTDSKGTAHDRRGLDPHALLEAKRTRGTIATSDRDAAWAVHDVDADVVVDLLPTDLRTGEPSFALLCAALRGRKDVVTASKGALALHEPALRLAVAASGRRFEFSGAVCGGTPVLELVAGAFRGDRLERFDAVLNGSTNYVLTRMEEGASWDEAIADARTRGILEADPSLDLLGHDAAAKAVILANAAWRGGLTLADADVRGILGVTAQETREARSKGLALRLVARGSPGKVSVAPVALPRDHPLVTEGTENAVRLKLASAGIVTLRGAGAGGKETASAVLSDILRIRDARAESVAPRGAAAPMVAQVT